MPQAIQPGTYFGLYGQQLQKSILTMASTNPTSALAMLTPSTMMTQADAMIGNTMASMDSMLATVGLGISPGIAASGTQTSAISGLGSTPVLGASALGGSLLGGQTLGGLTPTALGGASGDLTLNPSQMTTSNLMPMLAQMLFMLMALQNKTASPAATPRTNFFSKQTTTGIPDNSGALLDLDRTPPTTKKNQLNPLSQLSTFA